MPEVIPLIFDQSGPSPAVREVAEDAGEYVLGLAGQRGSGSARLTAGVSDPIFIQEIQDLLSVVIQCTHAELSGTPGILYVEQVPVDGTFIIHSTDSSDESYINWTAFRFFAPV